MTTADIARAREALNCIPADIAREEWARVGMAAQAAGLDFDDFDSWSASGSNYDARAARDTWRSFKDGKGVGAGTLFYIAGQHGYQNTKPSGESQLGRQIAAKLLSKSQAAKPAPKPGSSPAEVWARCEPATALHPYIVKKGAEGVPLDSLRVLPAGDRLRIGGHAMAGALVVPAFAPGGELQSLQLIPPDGPKMNLAGAPMAGASFTVGDGDGPLYVCEGIGAAWACWQATGRRAVCAFGWGNVARVAAQLRQREPGAHLVLVPDVGKEADADKIAREHGCMVAKLPEGWPGNSDVGDYMAAHDGDALAELLESAQAPDAPEPPEPHPLTRYIELGTEPKPPSWIIPGFIAKGVCVFAGGRGVGKTTAMLPMSLVAAGLHEEGYPLAPYHWRHVVYITEDSDQLGRILAGLSWHLRLSVDVLRERVHAVDAKRLPPAFVAQAGETYRKDFTRVVQGGVEVLPLVVIDTMASTLQLESENDNAEASEAIAALKQDFSGLPIWLIGHVTKANLTRADAASITLRGAGAFESDANQVLCMVREGDARWLVPNKVRFDPRWPELQLDSHFQNTTARNEFGEMEELTLRWSIARPPEVDRRAQAEQSKEEQRKEAEGQLRDAIRETVQTAWQAGNPLNREGAKAAIRQKRSDVSDCIERLLSERWLYEVPIPSKERQHPRRSCFLVNLTTEEHEAVTRGEPIPAEKLVIPDTWKKPIPSVPDSDGECSEKDSE